MAIQKNTGPALIKKYANRRLYNTETSCYITLEDLYVMIKHGEDFVVRDAKTDEDLTRSVLTQIIFEQEAKGYNLLPISFLRHVISMYDNSLAPVFPNYLEASMDSFMKNQERLRQFSAASWQEFTPLKIFENIAKQNMEIFSSALEIFKSSAADADKKQ
jgi:polyhydroxyalkanoate synthesis repressor PhaR